MIHTGRFQGDAGDERQQILCKQLYDNRAAMESDPTPEHAERYARSVRLALSSPRCAVHRPAPQAPAVQATPRLLGAWSLLAPLPASAFAAAVALVDTAAPAPVVAVTTASSQRQTPPPPVPTAVQSPGADAPNSPAQQAQADREDLQEEAEAVLLAGLDILRRHRLLNAWQQAAQQSPSVPSMAVRQIARAFRDSEISREQDQG